MDFQLVKLSFKYVLNIFLNSINYVGIIKDLLVVKAITVIMNCLYPTYFCPNLLMRKGVLIYSVASARDLF